jgi:hypothetical protein
MPPVKRRRTHKPGDRVKFTHTPLDSNLVVPDGPVEITAEVVEHRPGKGYVLRVDGGGEMYRDLSAKMDAA